MMVVKTFFRGSKFVVFYSEAIPYEERGRLSIAKK